MPSGAGDDAPAGFAWPVPQKALVDFTRSFAVMIGARLTLVQALTTAAKQCGHKRLRAAIEAVRRDVERGASLADSFAQHPTTFDALFVHLARIGEAAGVLDQVMLRLATYMEKSAGLRRKVLFALFYPLLILVVAIAATVFFLTVIVPTFAEMYADFGQELPGPTRVILMLSTLLTEYALHALVALGGCGLAGAAWLRTEQGRLRWDRTKLRVPLFGGIIRRSLVARFCRTLGTLVASGVALTDALAILAQASGNAHVQALLTQVLGRVKRGSSLYQPLMQTGVFPEMVAQMIAVGEQTAELDAMLLHAAAYYEDEVDSFLEALTSVIEPVLIIGIGLLLGSILVALYLPMFELIGMVG